MSLDLQTSSVTVTNSLFPCVSSEAKTQANADVKIVRVSQERGWDAFVEQHDRGSVCHLYGWRDVIERAYGHRTIYLAAMRGATIVGVCPLVLTKSLVFGNHLTSMPFLDYGGILAADSEVRKKLFDYALELSLEERAQLCLRFDHDPELGHEASLRRVTMKLKVVAGDVDATWKSLPGGRRNRVRRALNNGLGFEIVGEERLDDFYRVYSQNMRDLGSPVHSASFLQAVYREFRERSTVGLVMDGGTAIGAAFGLRFGSQIWVPWVSSLRSSFAKSPNELLYWKMIEHTVVEDCDTFDLGRSAVGDGTFEAKRQWGAEVGQLHWIYAPTNSSPEKGNCSKGTQGRVANLWKRLPLTVTNRLGPILRRQIPG